MSKLSPAQIIDIAIDYCREIEKSIPDSLRADFLAEFKDIRQITTIRDLTDKVCWRLKVLFKEPEVEKKYGQLRRQINDEIRWRIEIILADARQFLKNSFDRLVPGEPWILSKFTATSEGRLFYDRFALNYGRKFDLDLIKKILGQGEETERVLKGHCFRKRVTKNTKIKEKKVISPERTTEIQKESAVASLAIYDKKSEKMTKMRNKLKNFLLSLNPKQAWSVQDLRGWSLLGKPVGAALVRSIYRAYKGKFNEKIVREILGYEADVFLARNPFSPKLHILRDEEADLLIDTFFTFLQQIGQKYWSPAILLNWRSSQNEECGKWLYHYLIRPYRGLDNKINWLQILLKLYDQNKILYPFFYKKKLMRLPGRKSPFVYATDPHKFEFMQQSGICDPPLSVEEKYAEEEERSSKKKLLAIAIKKLSLENQVLAKKFLREEDIAPGKLSILLEALRKVMQTSSEEIDG